MKKIVEDGIERFAQHDLRAKVATDTPLEHPQELLGHKSVVRTDRVYRLKGDKIMPTKLSIKFSESK